MYICINERNVHTLCILMIILVKRMLSHSAVVSGYVLLLFFLSCLALRDLLVVYQSNEASHYLDELWEMSLRARDDIKVCVIQGCVYSNSTCIL